VSDGVLPAFLVLLKVRKSLGYVVVNLAQRRALVRRILEWKMIEKSSKFVGSRLTSMFAFISKRVKTSHISPSPINHRKNVNLLIASIHHGRGVIAQA
jgi:hypothetical protein